MQSSYYLRSSLSSSPSALRREGKIVPLRSSTGLPVSMREISRGSIGKDIFSHAMDRMDSYGKPVLTRRFDARRTIVDRYYFARAKPSWYDDLCIKRGGRNWDIETKLQHLKQRKDRREFEKAMYSAYGYKMRPQYFYPKKSPEEALRDVRPLRKSLSDEVYNLRRRGVEPIAGWSRFSTGHIVPREWMTRQSLMNACRARDDIYCPLSRSLHESFVSQRVYAERKLAKRGRVPW